MHFIQNNLDDSLIFKLSLGRITFLSCKEKNILAKKLDSYNDLALLSIEEISNLIDRPFTSKVIWNGKENLRLAKAACAHCLARGYTVLCNTDASYPELLRNIADPPYMLFCRGNADALLGRSVSVVGTRRLTPKGRAAAFDFAYQATLDGCNVVSGLAFGADGYAHSGAVNAFFDAQEADRQELGRTVAVLPGAIDTIVPSSQAALAERILRSGGCLVSEYEPGLNNANWHFVARNRIVAGLSPATVVIEAPVGSGALITADFALEEGRDVFFHEAAVSDMAMNVSMAVKRQLDVRFARKEVSKYKIENTVNKFLEAGATVIKDFYDYKAALSEMPGERAVPVLQEELF